MGDSTSEPASGVEATDDAAERVDRLDNAEPFEPFEPFEPELEERVDAFDTVGVMRRTWPSVTTGEREAERASDSSEGGR